MKVTIRKVRMCTGVDSCCYARDGRYFGNGTVNFDTECEACGRASTIGAHHFPGLAGHALRAAVRSRFGHESTNPGACQVCK